jgi:hypothetical protein
MPLPLLDEHSVMVPANRSVVWQAVRQYACGLAQSDHVVLGWVLGTEPTSGFQLVEEVEGVRLAMAGRHRFARYRLVFALDAEPGNATRLSILSFAAFPGARGRLYRGLLLGTGGHVLAVRHMLRTIQRQLTERAG